MIFTLTIAGVQKEIQAGSLRISKTANSRSTASFAVKSMDASYRPALDAEVIIEVDGTRIFGGLVDKPTEQGLFGGARPSIVTFVSAVDFKGYAERRVLIDIANPNPPGFPPGFTLHQALNGELLDGVGGLIAWVAPYGVTIDPAQVTGPTLPQMLYDGVYLSEVFDGIASLTANYGEPFVWTIDDFKVLRFHQPSTTPAPFDILTNDPGYVIGDIVDEPSREGYANRVYVRVAPKEVTGRVETFTGDGTTASFPLTYTLTSHRGFVNVDGIDQTLSHAGIGFDLAAFWLYYPATNTIRSVQQVGGVAVDYPQALGAAIAIEFDGIYSGRVMAQHASVFTDPWESLVTIPDVPDDTTLQAIADALLAEALLLPTTIRYTTHTLGLAVGQTQQITVPARALDTLAMITDIEYRDVNNRLVMDVTLLAGAQSNVGRRWQDTVRGWSDDNSGGGAGMSVGPGGGTSSGAAPPDTAVQVNDAGRFYGKSAFTFTKLHDSLVCGGGGSSITAAAFQSCQVFGFDCHIAD